jgi:hypothetical protein
VFWTADVGVDAAVLRLVPGYGRLRRDISDEAVGRRLARAIHGKGANVSADEQRAMLDRFPESERGRTIAHARTERSAAA